MGNQLEVENKAVINNAISQFTGSSKLEPSHKTSNRHRSLSTNAPFRQSKQQLRPQTNMQPTQQGIIYSSKYAPANSRAINRLKNSKFIKADKNDFQSSRATRTKKENESILSKIGFPNFFSAQEKLRSSSASHSSLNTNERQFNQYQQELQSFKSIIEQQEARIRSDQSRSWKQHNLLLQSQKKISSLERSNFIEHSKLQEASAHLKKQDEFLRVLETREGAKDKHIKGLEAQKLNAKNAIERLQSEIIVVKTDLEQRQKQIGVLNKKLAESSDELTKEATKNHELSSQLESVQRELSQRISQWEVQASNEKISHQRQLQTCEQKLEHLQNQYGLKMDEISKMSQEISNMHLHLDQKILKEREQCAELEGRNQELQALNQLCTHQRKQKYAIKQHLEELKANYDNASRVNTEQLEFMAAKAQQSQREVSILRQQLQLTKTIQIERGKLFERQIIYQLKSQNDRLWNTLINNEQRAVQGLLPELQKRLHSQTDRQHGLKIFNTSENSVSNYSSSALKGPSMDVDKTHSQLQLCNQYESFIRKLEDKSNGEDRGRQQHPSHQDPLEAKIGDLQVEKRILQLEADIEFYKKKSQDLESIVEKNLAINRDLKCQIDKYVKEGSALDHPRQQQLQKCAVLSVELDFVKEENKFLQHKYHKFSTCVEQRNRKTSRQITELQEINRQLLTQNQAMCQELDDKKQSAVCNQLQVRNLVDQITNLERQLKEMGSLEKQYCRMILQNQLERKSRSFSPRQQEDTNKMRLMNRVHYLGAILNEARAYSEQLNNEISQIVSEISKSEDCGQVAVSISLKGRSVIRNKEKQLLRLITQIRKGFQVSQKQCLRLINDLSSNLSQPSAQESINQLQQASLYRLHGSRELLSDSHQ